MAKWMNWETTSMAGDINIEIDPENPLIIFKTRRKY